jgi:hypothetical protein
VEPVPHLRHVADDPGGAVNTCRHCGVRIWMTNYGLWLHNATWDEILRASKEHDVRPTHGAEP